MRVTSDIWVGALRRTAGAEGAFVTMINRGAKEAGAIFVIVNRCDATFDLYGPAPQMFFDTEKPRDRKFIAMLNAVQEGDVTTALDRQKSFDPDIWIVEIEDTKGRCFLELVDDDDSAASAEQIF